MGIHGWFACALESKFRTRPTVQDSHAKEREERVEDEAHGRGERAQGCSKVGRFWCGVHSDGLTPHSRDDLDWGGNDKASG